MKPQDYPALWRSSDAASASAQWWFFLWLRLHLALLAITGLLAAWSPTNAKVEPRVSGIVAVLMLLAFVVGVVVRMAKLDDAWFQTRAFAENAKSAAWRFMMTPQPPSSSSESTELGFLDELRQIRERFPGVAKELAKHDAGGQEVTGAMRHARSKPMSERLAFYVQHRLDDQIAWYRASGRASGRAERWWQGSVLAIEAVAVIAAGIRLVVVREYNPTGAFAAVAACLLAWSHAKRFSDLASTYAVALQDLNALKTRAKHVASEEALAKFVADTEAAISREHRLWVHKYSAG